MSTNNYFCYTFSVDGNEHTVSLKPLGLMPYGVLKRARGDPDAQLHEPFAWGVVSAEDEAALELLPINELPKVLEAWQKHSEVSLGELPGSSNSAATGSSVKRSKRT